MKEIGCAGTIIGKAIYEGRISLEDLQVRFKILKKLNLILKLFQIH